MKPNLSDREISAKIFEGLKLSLQKLIEKKRKENGTLVFSENGKIVYFKP